MSTEVNKAAMRRIFDDVINGRNLDAADELYSDEHELHRRHPESAAAPRG